MLPTTKNAYEGFSWTTFFWGPLPPLFRADGIGFLIGAGLVAISLVVPLLPFLVWAFFYNRNHFDRLVSNGWYPAYVDPRLAPIPGFVSRAALDPPAGWYPDPSGVAGVRWWDGHRWTDTTG